MNVEAIFFQVLQKNVEAILERGQKLEGGTHTQIRKHTHTYTHTPARVCVHTHTYTHPYHIPTNTSLPTHPHEQTLARGQTHTHRSHHAIRAVVNADENDVLFRCTSSEVSSLVVLYSNMLEH